MRGTLLSALVLGAMAIGTLAPTNAGAEPLALTESQMDRVVAGRVPNINTAVQVAVAVPIGINICVICGDGVTQAVIAAVSERQRARQN